jgi:hypothetical protein
MNTYQEKIQQLDKDIKKHQERKDQIRAEKIKLSGKA